ncbi:aldose 1-epimerase [Dysgonomonas alginatilytica]|uniref:Aldose 1-epimerase n=1 Tax=Dysgonomonas alginatilytica TaxID=1605892 RepID=A0A2V3PJA8_9BACT|nr:aldose epimerase family protein [Dysgonomonas alginatilytica]PXV60200.1 aldose 1-epimerase [Dysgonomonas alginatilytica]
MKKIFYLGIALCLFSCGNKQAKPEQTAESGITLMADSAFTKTVDGKEIKLYTLESGNGITMQVSNFGGRVISLWTPDKDGKYEDIVFGHDNIDKYLDYEGERCLGPVVGRYANRIAKGQFTLDGKKHQLPLNNNGQTLHGGPNGFDMKVWNVDNISKNQIQLSYTSPDGEEGFPGTVNVKMIYTLTPENEFKITYSATTDKPTHVNLSHHSFFNLKGAGNGTITDHLLTINASGITPVDTVLIPTGKITSVEGTPFDFRTATAIGARINADDEQLKNGLGYDHNWVVDRKTEKDVEFIASLYEPTNGRVMEVWSDQPGIQFYSGNFLDGKVTGKYGKAHNYREAVALETQKYPDTPNQPQFPSTRLNPGEEYTQTCIYKFSTKK